MVYMQVRVQYVMYIPVETGKAGQLKAVVSRFVGTEYEIK